MELLNTTFRKIERPEKSEYPSYSQSYFDLVKTDDNILQELYDNFLKIKEFVGSLSEENLNCRYAEGKWTIKEILVHNIDDERIYAYRALRAARNDKTPLKGFEEKGFAQFSDAFNRSLESIFDEYWSVRLSTLTLFQNLPDEALLRKGCCVEEDGSLVNERTVRAFAYHIAGHELNHIKVIKERYLGQTIVEAVL